MNTLNEEQDAVYNLAYNPFPEPQTIPAGWDLSGFISGSQVDTIVDEQDSAESQL